MSLSILCSCILYAGIVSARSKHDALGSFFLFRGSTVWPGCPFYTLVNAFHCKHFFQSAFFQLAFPLSDLAFLWSISSPPARWRAHTSRHD